MLRKTNLSGVVQLKNEIFLEDINEFEEVKSYRYDFAYIDIFYIAISKGAVQNFYFAQLLVTSPIDT